MTENAYLYSTSTRFRIRDVLTLYEGLVALVDQVSPQTVATLVAVHDRLDAVGVPYLPGFSVQFPDGTKYTRGWQSETIESTWKEPE